jgi:RNA polymerase sigma factor (sigma-70 family)
MTDGAPLGSPRFATTRWSVVLSTRGEDTAAKDALAALCASYWYPLYAYARRRGASPEDAQDLVQGFFVVLLERGSLQSADPTRGRFRTFLLTAFQRHAAHERERAAAKKRGGGRGRLPFEIDDGESRYSREPVDERTPEALFERRWALTLLDRVLARLRDDPRADRKRLDALLPHLGGPGDARPYAEIAGSLGSTEASIKVAVHHLRKRCRELLRDEVAQTVAGPEETEDELRRLVAALAG